MSRPAPDPVNRTPMDHLIAPHGGELCELVLDAEPAEALKDASGDFLSITLNERQLCDLELLLCGGLSPLRGFMTRAEYESVVDDLHLPDGTLWSIPITLDIPEAQAEKIEPGQQLALRDGEGFMLAGLDLLRLRLRDIQRDGDRPQRTVRQVQVVDDGLVFRTGHESAQRRQAATQQQLQVAQLALVQGNGEEVTGGILQGLGRFRVENKLAKFAAVRRNQVVHGCALYRVRGRS